MEHSSVDVIAIDELRADAQRVSHGWFSVAMLLALVGLKVMRDHIRGPEWLSVSAMVLFLIGAFAIFLNARSYTSGMLKAMVCILGVFGFACLLAFVVGAPIAVYHVGLTEGGLFALFLGAIFLLLGVSNYWLVICPWLSARRLLAARLPPAGIPFTTVMEPLAAHRVFTDWSFVGRSVAERTGVAYTLAAVVFGVPALIGFAWTLVFRDTGLITTILSMAALGAAALLHKRGAHYSAIGAAEARARDTRAPILYLRSFMDETLSIAHDQSVERLGRFLRRMWPAAQYGEALEEVIAAVVRRRGPFIAIANPNEKLPPLGAARAHHSDETWQNAIVEWVQMAQLIVQVAGPTSWIRWELHTIVASGAGSKLMILFPPGSVDERSARWENFNEVLKTTVWGEAFASLDRNRVIGLRLLDGGRLLVVLGGKFQSVDYRLAVGILLGATQGQGRP